MNSTYNSTSPSLLFALGRAAQHEQRSQYQTFVRNCMAGRATPKRDNIDQLRALSPGTKLQASDRDYQVTENGNWVRVGEKLPRGQRQHSQIFIGTIIKGKYPKMITPAVTP